MRIINTDLPEVKIIEPKIISDSRGFFVESWNQKSNEAIGISSQFVQDNHSRSYKGVLRGLHYQIKHPQGKLVRVSDGSVFDVVVDMRISSDRFGQWTSAVLSKENNRQIWVPEGFAHGYLVLSETADTLYKCTDYYSPEHERTLIWNDPTVNVQWPISKRLEITLSEKDSQGMTLELCDCYP